MKTEQREESDKQGNISEVPNLRFGKPNLFPKPERVEGRRVLVLIVDNTVKGEG